MPGVTGMPVILAQVVLLARGLVAQVQTAPSSQAQGVVTAQAPAGGQPIEPGAPVRLWVSSGPRQVAPPRPTPQPEPAPPPPALHPFQPQPFQPQPFQPQPFQPQPFRPTPVVGTPPHRQPSQPAPITLPPTRPTLSATSTAPAVPPPAPAPSALPPASPATPQPVPPGNGGLLSWLGLGALAAAIAAGAALVLRARRRTPALGGAHVPFSVAATLAGGVKSTASDVHPSAAPTISVGWTIHLAPPRIEGLGAREPGA